jgi:tetratricopeptide (TPR) repeat protein
MSASRTLKPLAAAVAAVLMAAAVTASGAGLTGKFTSTPVSRCTLSSLPASGSPQKNKRLPDEKNPQAQYEMGVIALRYGLPDEAVKYGQQAVALDANFFNGWFLLGNAYYAKADYVQAAEAYGKAAALKPEHADVQRGLGLSLVEIKELDRAEAALKKSFALDGAFDSAFYLGKLYTNEARYDEALDCALKAIQKNGKNAGAYNLKGVILNQLKRYAEAAGSFQAGLVLAPEDVTLQVNLGIALFNSGQATKARGVFEAVLPKIEQDTLRKQVEDYIKAIKDAGK